MQVRASGPSGLADKADSIVLRYLCAAVHAGGDTAQVRIGRGILAAMAEKHDVAVAAFHSGELDHAIAHRAHARAHRRGVLDALMRAPGLRKGMPAHAETRAHAGELQRRAQERLAQILAVRRVVAAAEVNRAIVPALVHELGGEHTPGARRPPGEVIHLVHHREAVALAQVAVEVDVAAEHFAQLHGHVIRDARGIGGGEQRAADHARFHVDARLEQRALFADAVAVALRRDLHHGVTPAEEAQRDRHAIGGRGTLDRESTRLDTSHQLFSYALFFF